MMMMMKRSSRVSNKTKERKRKKEESRRNDESVHERVDPPPPSNVSLPILPHHAPRPHPPPPFRPSRHPVTPSTPPTTPMSRRKVVHSECSGVNRSVIVAVYYGEKRCIEGVMVWKRKYGLQREDEEMRVRLDWYGGWFFFSGWLFSFWYFSPFLRFLQPLFPSASDLARFTLSPALVPHASPHSYSSLVIASFFRLLFAQSWPTLHLHSFLILFSFLNALYSPAIIFIFLIFPLLSTHLLRLSRLLLIY